MHNPIICLSCGAIVSEGEIEKGSHKCRRETYYDDLLKWIEKHKEDVRLYRLKMGKKEKLYREKYGSTDQFIQINQNISSDITPEKLNELIEIWKKKAATATSSMEIKMGLQDRDYMRDPHPPACTCVDCNNKRLGIADMEGNTYSFKERNKYREKGTSPTKITKIVIFAIVAATVFAILIPLLNSLWQSWTQNKNALVSPAITPVIVLLTTHSPAPTASPSPTPTPTTTSSPSPTPSPTPTPVPITSPSPISSPTPVPTPIPTPTPVPTKLNITFSLDGRSLKDFNLVNVTDTTQSST